MKPLLISIVLTAYPLFGLTSDVKWYVSGKINQKLKDFSAEHITLGKEKTDFNLANGWNCVIGEKLNLSDARQTTCKKNKEQLSFVASCDTRQYDHVQIQFKSGAISDYIEVGCKK